MKKKNIILILGLLAIFTGTSYAQGLQFHGNVTNSIYSFEDTTSHTRMYQFVRMSLEAPQYANMSLNASLRALSDFNESLDDEDRFKAYALNLKIKRLFNRLDLTLGRQFLHPGTVLGGLDGLNATFAITKNIELAGYGGTEAHFNRSLKIYKAEDSFVAGGLFTWKNLWSNNIQLFYLQKANEEDTFWGITGANLVSRLIPRTNLHAQVHYDTENSQLHRLLISARNYLSQKLSLSLGFKSQQPQVYSNSFYQIFDVDGYNQYKLGWAYNLNKNYLLSGQYQFIQFDDDNANRVFLTFGNMNGSVGLVYETGYAGEQLGVVLDYAYDINPSLIASVNVDYSRYKTEKIYEFDNQIANAARLSYRFKRHWSADVEVQWLTNRFKDSDARILNHIHYSW